MSKKLMKSQVEEKKRFKMYKSKKNWVVAPIVFVGVLGAMGLATDQAQAAETETDSASGTEQVSSTAQETQTPSTTKPSEATVTQSTPSESTAVASDSSNVSSATDQADSTNSTTSATQNDTASQSTKTEEAVSKESANTTNVDASNNTTSDTTSTEVTAQDTSTAPETKSTVSSTDSTKVNVPATKVDTSSPELDAAVEEAKNTDGVTITENKVDLGSLSKEEAAKKKAEIQKEQLAKAKEITQKIAALKAANANIASENAAKRAEYNKKLAAYQKSLEEAISKSTEDGYLSSEQVKYLLFDSTTVKNAVLESVKADTYINAAEFKKLIGSNKDPLNQQISTDLSKIKTKTESKSKSDLYDGGSMVLMELNKPVTVTYTNLDASYDGKKITKVVYTYVLKSTPDKNGYLNAFIHNDPTITLTYGIGTSASENSKTEIEMTIQFFGEDGLEILPEEGKPFLFSGASLNSRGTDTSYEFMTTKDDTEFLKINGSYVAQHKDGIYSATDIDTGKNGVVTSDWDDPNNTNAYYGAGVFSSTGRISFTFGSNITNNPGFTTNAMWFSFNTDLKAYTVDPEPTLDLEVPSELDLTYTTYTMFEDYTPQPSKAVKDDANQDINNQNVMRGDSVNYEMTWDLKGYGSDTFKVEAGDVIKGVSFKDDYDQTKITPNKDLFRVTDANGNDITSQVNVIWDDVNGIVTAVVKDPEAFIKAYGGTELKVYLYTEAKKDVTGDLVNTAVQNTFGNEVNTNTVTNHIPQIDPVKDVVINVGDKDSIDKTTVNHGTTFNYELNSSVRPGNYGGKTKEWSMTDVLSVKDKATGKTLVLATKDFVLADGTKIAAGTDISKYFTVNMTTNSEGRQVFVFTANQEYLDIMNLAANKLTEQGWSVYIQAQRVGYGTIENTFDESYNSENEKSNTVETYTPQPIKEVKNDANQDINNQNVMRGDSVNYELTMDLVGYDKYQIKEGDVAKGVSFKDDYDQTKITPNKDLFKVTDANGNDITSQFNVIWDDENGIVTAVAKDPEAFIKAYGGTKLKIFLYTKAKKDVTGDLINTGVQNVFGNELETNTVINHISKIDPTKDVVVNVGDKESINNTTIAHGTVFNYELNTSIRPGNYGGNTEQWSIKDVLSVKDKATGQTMVVAQRDFVLADGTKIAAGTDISKYFTVSITTDAEGRQVVLFTANQEFLDIMNLNANKQTEQGWSAYVQVERVGYGTVENTFEESYNNEILLSNTVVTYTPEEPETPETPTPLATPVTPEKQAVEEVALALPEKTLPKTGEEKSAGFSIADIVAMVMGIVGFAFKRKEQKD